MTDMVPAVASGAGVVVVPGVPRGGDPAVWAAAVHALPGLPSAPAPDADGADPLVRYHPRALTAAWLDEADSAHTRRAYFRDLAMYLGWCASLHPVLDPLTARAADVGVFRAAQRTQPADSTVRRRLAALSSWYTYLVANGAARREDLASRLIDALAQPMPLIAGVGQVGDRLVCRRCWITQFKMAARPPSGPRSRSSTG